MPRWIYTTMFCSRYKLFATPSLQNELGITNNPASRCGLAGLRYKNPAITYSRPRRTTIGPACLTAVFGKGTGVATQVWSPGISRFIRFLFRFRACTRNLKQEPNKRQYKQGKGKQLPSARPGPG